MSRTAALGVGVVGLAMATGAGVAMFPPNPDALLLLTGLAIQCAALVVLFWRLGRHWVTHAGAYFILMAVLFHGANEILIWLFPGQDAYRFVVPASSVDQFVFVISVAILTLTIAYVVALRPASNATPEHSDGALAQSTIARVFDWRLMAFVAVPLFVLTLGGNGYVGPGDVTATTTSLGVASGLTNQYLLLAFALLSIGLVARFGQRWILPVLLAQSAAIAVIGQRTEIVVVAGMVLYAVARLGIRISRRQIVAGVGVCLLALVVVTSGRAAQGHIASAAGADLRLNYLIAGVTDIGSQDFWNEVAFGLGHRFDGNSFGALELDAMNKGFAPLGAAPLGVDLRLAVPSFLLPDKLGVPFWQRSEKEYAESAFSIPLPYVAPGVHEDILPTELGAAVAFAGPWWLMVIAAMLGLAFAAVDRWLLKRLTPIRLFVALALVYCVLEYPGSWSVYPIMFRGVLVVIPLIWLLQKRASRPRQTQRPRAYVDGRYRSALER